MNALRNLRNRLEAEGYQVSVHLLAPGTVFGAHCASEARIEAVFSGRLRLVIGGQAHLLGPGDWLEVPGGEIIVTEVIGDEPVLGMDAARLSGALRPAKSSPRRAPPAPGSRRRSPGS